MSNQKIDGIDTLILNAAAAQPNASIHAVASNLVKSGLINNVQLAYDRLKRKDYLSRAFAEIQQNHRETFSRELMPLAIKKTRKALKTLDEKAAYPYVAMTVKTTLGDQGPASPATTINIGQMQVLQGIMRGKAQDIDGAGNE